MTLARYGHHTLIRPVADRLAVLGDAAHSTSPQLGQGANMALLDALALAEALRLTGDAAAAPAMAVHLRRWRVQVYQWATALFTPMYQSDSTFQALLRDRLLAPSSRFWPGKQVQALLMSGLFGGPLQPLGLARIDYSRLSARD